MFSYICLVEERNMPEDNLLFVNRLHKNYPVIAGLYERSLMDENIRSHGIEAVGGRILTSDKFVELGK